MIGIPAKKDIVYHDDPPSVLFCDRLPAKNLLLLVVPINEPFQELLYKFLSSFSLPPIFFFFGLSSVLGGMIRFNGNINFYVLNAVIDEYNA